MTEHDNKSQLDVRAEKNRLDLLFGTLMKKHCREGKKEENGKKSALVKILWHSMPLSFLSNKNIKTFKYVVSHMLVHKHYRNDGPLNHSILIQSCLIKSPVEYKHYNLVCLNFSIFLPSHWAQHNWIKLNLIKQRHIDTHTHSHTHNKLQTCENILLRVIKEESPPKRWNQQEFALTEAV